jgi:hypothetical protein
MMKLLTKIALLFVFLAGALSMRVFADERTQKTVLTFSGPVEIPGQVLPAGTYVFKLADSPSSRQIVQVFNKEENQIFGTFLTIPDYRLKPAEKTIINFHERPSGSPDAIKAWFYPGKNYGHEFVYPKSEARVLAEANHTPVPALGDDLAQEIAQPTLVLSQPEIRAIMIAPLMAEEEGGREVNLAVAFPSEHIQPASSPADLPEELPETASFLPLLGIAGGIALVTAMLLRRFAPSR